MAIPSPISVTMLTAYVDTSVACASSSAAPTPPVTERSPIARQTSAAMPVPKTINRSASATIEEPISAFSTSAASRLSNV